MRRLKQIIKNNVDEVDSFIDYEEVNECPICKAKIAILVVILLALLPSPKEMYFFVLLNFTGFIVIICFLLSGVFIKCSFNTSSNTFTIQDKKIFVNPSYEVLLSRLKCRYIREFQ